MKAPPTPVTLAVVAVTATASLVAQLSGQHGLFTALAGFIPARVGGAIALPEALPVWLTPLTSTLLHAGLLHLLFNMLVLAYCGRATERVVGGGGMAVLYVVGAFAAAAAQWLSDPSSTVPMIGASGPASAVIAAYALFYGERKRRPGSPRTARALTLLQLAAGWIGLQLLIAFAQADLPVLIAVAAHIGGFLAGLALAQPLLRWRYRKA